MPEAFSPLTPFLVSAGVLSLLVMLVVGFACVIRCGGLHPLLNAFAVLPRDAVERLLFVTFTCGIVHYAVSKGTNAPPRESAELRMENEKWKVENEKWLGRDSPIFHSPFYTLHSVSANDSYSFAMPSVKIKIAARFSLPCTPVVGHGHAEP